MLIFITQQVVALKEKGDMSMQLYNEQILNRMLDYIKQYQTENGKSPTYRLIGKSVGIENPGTVARYINQLKIRGLIDKDNGGAVAIDPRLFSGRTKTVSLVGTVACGMPILAEENIEGNFQLPVELFGNDEHFMLYAKGYSMIDKGIYNGDIIVAKKQAVAKDGQVVVALIDNEAMAKIFYRKRGKVVLRAANDSVDEYGNRNYPDIVTENCSILGIVDNVIHRVK